MAESGQGVLSAPLVIEYPFSRTTGPTIGAFLAGLREKVLVGAKTGDGRVIVPPSEYDPATGEDITELVEVGRAGTVTTWAWVCDPMPKHPLDRPFAWALIRPDGADTAMLHAVDAASMDAVHTGLRVVPRWREEREGSILDLECWEPAPASDKPPVDSGPLNRYPPHKVDGDV
ncbi:MAG: Zn-ribbon domain-containing OB-fold protein, partial [Acidimicrobiales bacterium]